MFASADGERNGQLFSSSSDEWRTPRAIIDAVLELTSVIDLDPCTSPDCPDWVPARAYHTKQDDGLAQQWTGFVYMNPPYGREISRWVEKLVAAEEAGVAEGIALLPARVDTRWWRRVAHYPVCFPKTRLRFEGAPGPAPFPSALVFISSTHHRQFAEAFESIGPTYRIVHTGVFS